MKKYPPTWLVLVALFLTGCVPSERFWWAPDGETAAVVVEGQLHLVDERGHLGESIVLEGGDAEFAVLDGVNWFADSSGFVAHRAFAAGQWAEFVPLIPEVEAQRIEQISAVIPDMLRSAIVIVGDAEKISSMLDRISSAQQDFVRNAFLLALESRPESVLEALAEAPKARADLDEFLDNVHGFIVHQIVSVSLDSDTGVAESKVLHRSAEALASPKISSQFPLVAFTRIFGNSKKLVSIEVISTEGGSATICAKRVHPAFDWSIDGRSLTTMAPAASEGLLTQIKSTQLLDSEGNWLPRKKRVATSLTVSVMPFAPRIETLPNGDLLFASRSGDFPVVNAEAPFEAHLYRFSIEDQKLRRISTATDALPMNLGYFVASPDGERVAVVESETDAIAIVELATGKTEIISPPHSDWKCRTLPNWRKADEVSFAALDTSSKRIEWTVWNSKGKTRTLSEDWPESHTADWLELAEKMK